MAHMRATVEIDKSGRLVVPKKMRDALHLRLGDKLDLEMDGETMTLAPQRVGRGLYEEGGWLVYDSGVPITVEQSLRLVQDSREERHNFLMHPETSR
jgi:AbrB family looped-hinge helix DNA binding protein